MAKKKYLLIFSIIVILGSCATTQEAPVEDTGDVTIEQLDTARESAQQSKTDADSIKAEVSAKEDYEAGIENMTLADEYKTEGKNKEALSAYNDSETSFAAAYEKAEEKRKAALKAIEKAENAIFKAEEKALEAEEETSENGGNE